ncbi:MAG: 7-cyano-7-deazaguanine synthase QueC [Acidimicrobiia bacterium]
MAPGSLKPAVVLLSGGLDSATVAAMAARDGFRVHALSFRYGQRHAVELDAARRVVGHLGLAEHRVIDIDLASFGGSALTDPDIDVPKDGPAGGSIPVTYVPARNTVFLAYALAWAEVLGSADVFLGVNALDYSGYPDCRPEYVAAFETMANLATKAAVEGRRLRVHAPLIAMTKAEIIQAGAGLGVDYGLTTSCYDPADDGAACAHCDSCRLRARGFAEAGRDDPTRYVAGQRP